MSNRESISGTRLNETPIFTNTYRRAVVTMGIKDLWSQALGNIKKKDAVPFSTLKGRVVGIDVSIWLHKYCHRTQTPSRYT